MSKKHYEAIAKILATAIKRQERIGRETLSAKADESVVVLKDVGEQLGAYFADDNERFDGERFLKAAGIR